MPKLKREYNLLNKSISENKDFEKSKSINQSISQSINQSINPSINPSTINFSKKKFDSNNLKLWNDINNESSWTIIDKDKIGNNNDSDNCIAKAKANDEKNQEDDRWVNIEITTNYISAP